jgi:hypothetical protein
MAIAHVKNVGSNANKTSAQTVAVTVPAAGVASGNALIVSVYSGDNAKDISGSTCSDTQGNTYRRDKLVPHGSPADTPGLVVFVARVGTALVSGNTVTIAFKNGSGTNVSIADKAMVVEEFSGFGPSAPDLEVSGTGATGNSTTPSANATVANSGERLVYGVVGVEGPSGDLWIEDSDSDGGVQWVGLTRAGTTGGSAASNSTLGHARKILDNDATTHTYTPTTGLNARNWSDVVLVYKPLVSSPTITAVPASATASAPAPNPNFVLTGVAHADASALAPGPRLSVTAPPVSATASGLAAVVIEDSDTAPSARWSSLPSVRRPPPPLAHQRRSWTSSAARSSPRPRAPRHPPPRRGWFWR